MSARFFICKKTFSIKKVGDETYIYIPTNLESRADCPLIQAAVTAIKILGYNALQANGQIERWIQHIISMRGQSRTSPGPYGRTLEGVVGTLIGRNQPYIFLRTFKCHSGQSPECHGRNPSTTVPYLI